MRHAIYVTPARDHPLTRAAADWLGRDAFTPGSIQQPVNDTTAEPARYGFHGTLVAPFRLATGYSNSDLAASLDGYCATQQAFVLPLRIGRLGPFFALVPAADATAIRALADAAVAHFSPLRAPLSDEDYLRRKPERLTEAQRDYLLRWGYPYVFSEFRFHMTLTGPVDEHAAAGMEALLNDVFSSLLTEPLTVESLSIFTETTSGQPFHITHTAPFAAAATART